MKTSLSDHLEKVKYFQVVGEVGSIQEASKRIGIAQPALSKSIKILESAIGCLLLERTRKGTNLTSEGEALLEFSYSMKDLIGQFEDNISSNKGISGNVTVGTHELYVPHLWPRISHQVKTKSPDLNLKLITDVNSSILMTKLSKQNLDIVIAIDSTEMPTITKSLYYTDKFSFYCSSTFHEKPGKNNIFYLPNSTINPQKTLQNILSENNMHLTPQYEVSSYASILSLIFSSEGIGILPEKPASFYVKKGLIVKVKSLSLKQEPHGVFVYTRKSSAESRNINYFLSKILKTNI